MTRSGIGECGDDITSSTIGVVRLHPLRVWYTRAPMEYARWIRNPIAVPTQAPAGYPQGPDYFYFSVDLGPGYAYYIAWAKIQIDSGGQFASEQRLAISPNIGFYNSYPNVGGLVLEIDVNSTLPNSSLIVLVTQQPQLPAPTIACSGLLVSGSTNNAIAIA